MAELATIARPYAEALFKATPQAEQSAWVAQVAALGQVARDAQVQGLADNPRARRPAGWPRAEDPALPSRSQASKAPEFRGRSTAGGPFKIVADSFCQYHRQRQNRNPVLVGQAWCFPNALGRQPT